MKNIEGMRAGAIRNAQRAIVEADVRYMKNPKVCSRCQKLLTRHQAKAGNIYCGHSCAAKTTNIQRASIRYCLNCQKKTSSKKFCGRNCQHEFARSQYIKLWLKGQIEGGNSHTISPHVRKYLRQLQNNACIICKRKTWLNQSIPLVADHINGDPDDHSPKNVRLICGNCDMLQPTYKGRNKGSGRHIRRERYSKGLSY